MMRATVNRRAFTKIPITLIADAFSFVRCRSANNAADAKIANPTFVPSAM